MIIYIAYKSKHIINTKTITLGLISFTTIIFFTAGRSYKQGFDLYKVFNTDSTTIINGALNEFNIHLAMGSVIEYIPDYRDYDFLSPIYIALTSPIPRALWEKKPYPSYLEAIPMALRDPSLETSGAAIPIYGEWYMMGGYATILLIGTILLTSLQIQYTQSIKNNKIGLAMSVCCFCAYSFTRGYLAQNLLSYFIIVLPTIIFYKKITFSRQ
jgi:hypothetical protein